MNIGGNVTAVMIVFGGSGNFWSWHFWAFLWWGNQRSSGGKEGQINNRRARWLQPVANQIILWVVGQDLGRDSSIVQEVHWIENLLGGLEANTQMGWGTQKVMLRNGGVPPGVRFYDGIQMHLWWLGMMGCQAGVQFASWDTVTVASNQIIQKHFSLF